MTAGQAREPARAAQAPISLPSATTAAEKQAIQQLLADTGARQRIQAYAARNTSKDSIKGVIAEELFYKSPRFDTVRQQALNLAKDRGIPAASVRFERVVRGRTPTEAHTGSISELGDGMFVAEKGGKLHILTVIESKSAYQRG